MTFELVHGFDIKGIVGADLLDAFGGRIDFHDKTLSFTA